MDDDFKDFIEEDSPEHINSDECCCPDCVKEKSPYIQIIDIERAVDNLDDWD